MVCFFACKVWCIADVSSFSPSSEQTQTSAVTPNLTGEKHTIPTIVDQNPQMYIFWIVISCNMLAL